MATLEEEQKRIEVEQKRLSYMEHRLELEKKSFEYARELARLGAAISSPDVQTDIKAIIVQLWQSLADLLRPMVGSNSGPSAKKPSLR
jgi:hypothetical protein